MYSISLGSFRSFTIPVIFLGCLFHGQDAKSAAPIQAKNAVGASVESVRLDESVHSAVVRIANNSNKNIAGFTIAYAETFADGTSRKGEYMVDRVPGLPAAPGVRATLGPGETEAVQIGTSPQPLRSFEARIIVVVYEDKTAEVADEEAFQRFVQHRKDNVQAHSQTKEVLDGVLADPIDNHPAATALRRLNSLLEQARREHNGELATTLERTISNVQHIAGHRDSRSERERLADYARVESQQAAAIAGGEQIRRQEQR